jgi:hypothetical protein
MWINNRIKQYATTTTLSEENTCSDPHKKRREKILVVIIFTREKIKLLLGKRRSGPPKFIARILVSHFKERFFQPQLMQMF